MKRWLLIIMTLATVLSFTACTSKDAMKPGDNDSNKTGNETSNDNESNQSDDNDDDQQDDNDSGQTDDNDEKQPDNNDGNQPDDNETTDPDDTNEPGDDDSNILEGSLEDIIAKIYETADVDDNFKEYAKSGLYNEEVTAERAQYFLGKADLEFESALASEPMIQPGAYSLVLVRVKEGADVEQIKKDIKDNVDPMKWICVSVQEENIIVDSIGNLVFLVMSDDQAKPLHDAFLALEK